MDWHKLQHTLFEMDPTDPREDLAKLKQAAEGGGSDVPPTKDYVNESVEVPEGSMPIGIDNIADFAALAGVRLDEKYKKGSAGQLKGKDSFKTNTPTKGPEQKHPARGKLVGEDGEFSDKFKQGMSQYNTLGAIGGDFDADRATKGGGQSQDKTKIKGSVTAQQLGKQMDISNPTLFQQAIMKLKQGGNLTRQQEFILAEAFKKLMAMDPQQTQKVMTLLKRVEVAQESEQPKIKPRDPNSQYMNDLRKSGAMGAHKDKKKDAKAGKVKHKGQQYESIKDMLYAKLAEKK